MSATNRGCERKAYDFYATPPETVRAFLANFDGISSGDRILEPSAGNGQIVKVLREGGYDNRIDAVELRPEEGGTGCIGHQNHLRRTSAWKTLT